jgi:thiol-disulfide isomerase/thioredoxin
MKQLKWTGILLALGTSASLALAAEVTLKVGDPAPKLQTGKWVQGEPVKNFEKGKAYIVEFWATWCGPCRVSIPHLNEIHNKYKDQGLVVIGQDCWERDDTLVAPFVKKMDDKMTYRVAMDDKEGDAKGMMAKTWMAAAGRNGIPSAFLVDTKGIIAWIGHPMDLKESVIEDVLAGKFDVKKAAQKYDEEQRAEAKSSTIWNEISRSMQKKDWDNASAKLAEVEAITPEDQRDNLAMTRFRILVGQKDYAAAYKVAKSFSDAHQDNTMVQNELAWEIATDKSITQRDLPLAEVIARRAALAAKGKDAAVLDTLARVLFMQDKKDEAIAVQQSAVELADGDMKAELQKSLDSYKRGELSKSN